MTVKADGDAAMTADDAVTFLMLIGFVAAAGRWAGPILEVECASAACGRSHPQAVNQPGSIVGP